MCAIQLPLLSVGKTPHESTKRSIYIATEKSATKGVWTIGPEENFPRIGLGFGLGSGLRSNFSWGQLS